MNNVRQFTQQAGFHKRKSRHTDKVGETSETKKSKYTKSIATSVDEKIMRALSYSAKTVKKPPIQSIRDLILKELDIDADNLIRFKLADKLKADDVVNMIFNNPAPKSKETSRLSQTHLNEDTINRLRAFVAAQQFLAHKTLPSRITRVEIKLSETNSLDVSIYGNRDYELKKFQIPLEPQSKSLTEIRSEFASKFNENINKQAPLIQDTIQSLHAKVV